MTKRQYGLRLIFALMAAVALGIVLQQQGVWEAILAGEMKTPAMCMMFTVVAAAVLLNPWTPRAGHALMRWVWKIRDHKPNANVVKWILIGIGVFYLSGLLLEMILSALGVSL